MSASALPTALPEIQGVTLKELEKVIHLAKAIDVDVTSFEKFISDANEIKETANSYKKELDLAIVKCQKAIKAARAEAQDKVDEYQKKVKEVQEFGVREVVPDKEGIVKHSWHDRLATDIKLGRTAAVRGSSGNGKSTGVRHVLEALGYKVYHLDCTDSTTADMLVGGLRPVPDGKGGISMEFEDGIITKAFADPKGAIQLDEFDALDPRVAMVLQSALHRGSGEKPRRWVSSPDHKKGGIPSKGLCPIVITMNTWGNGATREYVGRNTLDSASVDRFNSIIDTDYEYESKILMANGIPETVANSIVNHAKKVRKAISDDGFKVICSTRRLLDIAEAMVVLKLNHETAWNRDFYGRIDKPIAEAIRKKHR